jgi:NitT/TauT family transport system substrate-binding protein
MTVFHHLTWPLLMALILCTFPVTAQEKPSKLTVSYPTASASQAVMWVAKDTGIFRQHQLDVDLVYLSGGPRSMASLLSGQIQIIGTGGNSLVAANLKGAKDAVLIATTYNTLVFSLMTRSDIKEPRDLRSKIIGVSAFGSLSDFTLRTLLKKWSIDANREVAIRPIGGIPEILGAMQARILDGGVLSPPSNLRAESLGFREFADAGTLDIEYASTCYATTRRFIREKRETVDRFVRSLIEAIHFLKTDKVGAIGIMQKYTKVQEPKILAETYRAYALRYLAKAPYPTAAGVATILESMLGSVAEAKDATPEQFIDASFVQDLDKSGWIDRLYR